MYYQFPDYSTFEKSSPKMQTGNERRIREVWETTQENLETAVGTAYSGWNSIYYRHVQPFFKDLSDCCCCCSFGNRPNRPNLGRRDSFDIFFDMYDDDEAFGRDELERLLTAEEQQQNSIDGDGYEGDQDSLDAPPPPLPPPPAQKSIFDYLIPKRDHSKKKSTSIWHSLFPSQVPYRPSTSDLQFTRPRSDTKSSTKSSETYRSRRDLFSDSDQPVDDDAQMVSDNFAANLVFKRQNSATSSSLSSYEPHEQPQYMSQQQHEQQQQYQQPQPPAPTQFQQQQQQRQQQQQQQEQQQQHLSPPPTEQHLLSPPEQEQDQELQQERTVTTTTAPSQSQPYPESLSLTTQSIAYEQSDDQSQEISLLGRRTPHQDQEHHQEQRAPHHHRDTI